MFLDSKKVTMFFLGGKSDQIESIQIPIRLYDDNFLNFNFWIYV